MRIKYEIDCLRTALMFYTRIPVGTIRNYTDAMLSDSTRYFPLVGWVVGVVAAVVFGFANLVLPVPLAILVSMAASIFLTGAFHEDGFADFCDGFGGGYTPERILDIMKDSRNGTYATVGVSLILATKFYALNSIGPVHIMAVMLAGHAFSRLFPVLLIYTSDYVRLDALSKSKPIGKRGSVLTLILAVLFSVLPLALIAPISLVYCVPLLVFIFGMYRRYVIRKLGGYTGDVLGALQQLCEVFFYLAFVAAAQNNIF